MSYNLIKCYTNSTNQINPLPLNQSRFLINATIDELISNLFIEKRFVVPNYSLYYQQCSPSSCSYNYIQQINILYTITLVLGFQGGLTIVLKWICPKLIQMFGSRKKRNNVVHSFQIMSTRSDHNKNLSSNIEVARTNTNVPIQSSFKLGFILILIIIILISLMIFSVFTIRSNKNQFDSTGNKMENVDDDSTYVFSVPPTIQATKAMTSATMNMTRATMSTSISPYFATCQLEFQPISLYLSVYDYIKISTVDDFNHDNRLDLIYFSAVTRTMNVRFGYNNGTFGPMIVSNLNTATWVDKIVLSDFDQGNQLDIAFIDINADQVGILLGNGDGTFRTLNLFSTGNNSSPRDIVAVDFNIDDYADIAVVNYWQHNVAIFYAIGNGNFSLKIKLDTGRISCPIALAVVDINEDAHLDIIVVNNKDKSIGVFLANGEGNFNEQMISFAGGGFATYPVHIAVGQLNDDSFIDVVLSYTANQMIGIMFGYENGTFSSGNTFSFQSNVESSFVSVFDLNCDRHSDIIVGQTDPFGSNVLIGNGHGQFQVQTIFSTPNNILQPFLTLGDFNGDHVQDILLYDEYFPSLYILFNHCQCCLV
ncbi:unnamed protein product [Adineta ricciae]|uniref:Uncharacterized protein n=1 Tax=Adineta ricciae TaxID=249248 RepID=A0A815UBM6_ADIRI|nr:unnamed protein product [Adineta ricciae]